MIHETFTCSFFIQIGIAILFLAKKTRQMKFWYPDVINDLD